MALQPIMGLYFGAL